MFFPYTFLCMYVFVYMCKYMFLFFNMYIYTKNSDFHVSIKY